MCIFVADSPALYHYGDAGVTAVGVVALVAGIKAYVMRFLGNIEAKLDAKGRVFLPAAFRKVLQVAGEDGLVIRKDVYQQCLVLYPESVWGEQMDSLRRRLNRWDRDEQQLFRQFVSQVEPVTLDGNGRFLISKRCLRQAGIAQDVRFIGMGDTIEIWPAGNDDDTFMDASAFGEAMERLMTTEAEAQSGSQAPASEP